jgi:hypothetical protein
MHRITSAEPNGAGGDPAAHFHLHDSPARNDQHCRHVDHGSLR